VATLSKHASRRARTTAVRDGEDTAPTTTTRATRAASRRASAPRSRLGYAAGITTVCALALVNMLTGQPATATVEPTGSVAVAEALGIGGTEIPQTATPEDAQALGQLAASRAERAAEQAEAAQSQSQAEQAAAEAKAAEERAAAEAAAAAAAAEAEAAAAAEAEAAEATEATEATETEESAPAPAGTAVTAIAQISNSAGPISGVAQAAANAVVSNVPGAGSITIGGTRPSAADPGGHPSGLALDYMVLSDAALGDAIVEYHIANWDTLGVEYIIWQQRMLSSPGGSWSYMEDRGSATANHMDHPHVNYRG
jgi:hypothetical protein